MMAFVRVVALWCALRFGDGAPISAQDVEIETSWDVDSEEVYASLGRVNFAPKPMVRSGVGVVYSAAGEREFVQREVLPTVEYLRRQLRIAGARGNSDGGGGAASRPCGFALFTERPLVASLSSSETAALDAFFDRILLYEDWRSPNAPRSPPLKARSKLVKIHAMAQSPFATTVFLDFDARPCRADFAALLAPLVGPASPGGADVALTNKFDGQGDLDDRDHYRLEHNSACVVLDATSARTQAFLGLYLEAFAALFARNGEARDQPALAVALRRARDAGLSHADISPAVFCRNKISAVVSCDAGCAIVHKPQKHDLSFKTFALGSRGTGVTTVAMMLDALKLEPRCDVAARLRAADAYLGASGDPEPALAAAARYRTFHDLPWGGSDLYRDLAASFPRAKFVLTTRPPVDWWLDAEAYLSCARPAVRDRYAAALGEAWDAASDRESDGDGRGGEVSSLFAALSASAETGAVHGPPWFRTYGADVSPEEARVRDGRAARFTGAYSKRNAAIVAFFETRGEGHRLLVLDDIVEADRSRAWSAVCNFLEAWSSCPSTRPLPGASLAAERRRSAARRRDAGDEACRAALDAPIALTRGSFGFEDREALTGLATPPAAATGRGARLREYKLRVAAYLNSTKVASTTPPKPPPPRKSLPRSQRLALRVAAPARDVPRWRPVLESITGRRPAWDIFKSLYLAQIELVFHDS